MPITVDIQYRRSEKSGRDAKSTLDYLKNIETAIPDNFPGLEALEQVQPEVYRWKFEKISYGGHDLTLSFVTRFRIEEVNRITMDSLADPSSSKVRGHWTVSSANGQVTITFELHLEIQLPLPFFLKSVATPIAQKEITKLFDRYLINVAKTLSS